MCTLYFRQSTSMGVSCYMFIKCLTSYAAQHAEWMSVFAISSCHWDAELTNTLGSFCYSCNTGYKRNGSICTSKKSPVFPHSISGGFRVKLCSNKCVGAMCIVMLCWHALRQIIFRAVKFSAILKLISHCIYKSHAVVHVHTLYNIPDHCSAHAP